MTDRRQGEAGAWNRRTPVGLACDVSVLVARRGILTPSRLRRDSPSPPCGEGRQEVPQADRPFPTGWGRGRGDGAAAARHPRHAWACRPLSHGGDYALDKDLPTMKSDKEITNSMRLAGLREFEKWADKVFDWSMPGIPDYLVEELVKAVYLAMVSSISDSRTGVADHT
jgi:hypothetical protein